MNHQPNTTRTRRVFFAAGATATGVVAVAVAAWLAASPGANWSWRDLHGWYNPAVGFHSAALPVGFEDLVDRIKPAVVGVRAKVEQDDEDEKSEPAPDAVFRQAGGFLRNAASPPARGQASSYRRMDLR